jgi:NADP-dependent 3-hydroxy acid dehydrogenase YdfG
MTSTPVWFITAATSGFGKGIALSALSRGHKVLATGRSFSRLTDLKEAGADVYELDVTSKQEVLDKTVAEAHSKYGRIDYLVNGAGYILVGAVEEVR